MSPTIHLIISVRYLHESFVHKILLITFQISFQIKKKEINIFFVDKLRENFARAFPSK